MSDLNIVTFAGQQAGLTDGSSQENLNQFRLCPAGLRSGVF